MKKFFIVTFLFFLAACSAPSDVSTEADSTSTPRVSPPTRILTATSPASPAPANTLTPVSTNVGAGVPSWPTGTPLPSLQPGRSFVLTHINMMDEDIGWGTETTGHLLRTTDSGSTWKDVTPPEAGFYAAADTLHAWDTIKTRAACDICPGGATMGLVTWHTSDGGETWQRGTLLNDGEPDFRPIAMHFVSETKGWFLFVYQIGMNGFALETLVRTTDGGESWIPVQLLSDGCFSGGMIFVDEQEGWIGDDCRSLSNMLDGITLQDFLTGKAMPSLNRTTDGGNTWNSFLVPAPTVFPSNFTVSEIDPGTWFYCGIEQMDKISQMAFLLQWSCNTAHSTISAEALYAYLTPDGGQTWRSWLSTGNENFINATTGWRLLTPGDGQPNSLQQTTDGGSTWMTIKAVAWQTAQFDFVSEQVGWAIVSDGTNTAFVHTSDGGKTWSEIELVITQ